MKIIERLKPHWAWIASAVLVAGALAVVHSTGPDVVDVPIRAGQFIEATLPGAQAVDTATLRIPGSEVTVAVTDPIDPADVDDFEARADPTGGSYLGLTITADRSSEYPVSVIRRGMSPDRDRHVTIAVYADGRRYPLPYDSSAPSGYLAVPGRPRDVRFAITVDGVQQTVRPSTGQRVMGKARSLYVETPRIDEQKGCGTATFTRGFRFDRPTYGPPCEMSTRGRSAYLDGLGWAAPGMLWQYVELAVDHRLSAAYEAAGRPAHTYRSVIGDYTLAVRIDGRLSVGSPLLNAGGSFGYDKSALAVVQVPQDAPTSTVAVVATFHRLVKDYDTRADPSAPVDPDVSVTWTESLS